MLYFFNKQNRLQPLPILTGMVVKETRNPILMAELGKLSVTEAAGRFASNHRAYVAYLENRPAAFGWMAMSKARIGELNHEIVLPANHVYLWNFRTLEEFRGLGIYPRLLQHILLDVISGDQCAWIMHAPENTASEKGIMKAGFTFAAQVSIRYGNEVIFSEAAQDADISSAIIQRLGFSESKDTQATCWKCSSPFLAHKKTVCCCEERSTACNEALFAI